MFKVRVALAALREGKTMAERCDVFALYTRQAIDGQRLRLEHAADAFEGAAQRVNLVDLAPLRAHRGRRGQGCPLSEGGRM